jgi:predicted DNA-binding protein (MmcQ/YjbR family)
LLDGSLKDSTILKLIEDSYELTRPKMRKAIRKGDNGDEK